MKRFQIYQSKYKKKNKLNLFGFVSQESVTSMSDLGKRESVSNQIFNKTDFM